MIQRWKAMGDENGEAAGASSGAIVQVSLCMLAFIQAFSDLVSIYCMSNICWGFPGGSVVKNLPANAGDMSVIPVRKIPWRRKWQPTPVFLPGKSHGRRSLVSYSP